MTSTGSGDGPMCPARSTDPPMGMTRSSERDEPILRERFIEPPSGAPRCSWPRLVYASAPSAHRPGPRRSVSVRSAVLGAVIGDDVGACVARIRASPCRPIGTADPGLVPRVVNPDVAAMVILAHHAVAEVWVRHARAGVDCPSSEITARAPDGERTTDPWHGVGHDVGSPIGCPVGSIVHRVQGGIERLAGSSVHAFRGRGGTSGEKKGYGNDCPSKHFMGASKSTAKRKVADCSVNALPACVSF
jgi:hypothetical protein